MVYTWLIVGLPIMVMAQEPFLDKLFPYDKVVFHIILNTISVIIKPVQHLLLLLLYTKELREYETFLEKMQLYLSGQRHLLP
jgi:hypothetical protein